MSKVDFHAFIRKVYEVRAEALEVGIVDNALILYMGRREWKEMLDSVPWQTTVGLTNYDSKGNMLLGIPVYLPDSLDTSHGHAILFGNTMGFPYRWAYEFEIPLLEKYSNAPSLSANSEITGREPMLSKKER